MAGVCSPSRLVAVHQHVLTGKKFVLVVLMLASIPSEMSVRDRKPISIPASPTDALTALRIDVHRKMELDERKERH